MFGLEKEEHVVLHKYLETLGYKPEQRNGEAMFCKFSNSEEEYRILVQGVGCRIVSSSLLEMRGNDSLDFLHRITTNDLKTLPSNRAASTIFTNEKGRILDRVVVLNFGEKQVLIGNHGTQKKLFLWIQRYVIMDDVHVSEASKSYGVLEILGPQAKSFMTLLCGDNCNHLEENEIRQLSVDDTSFFVFKNTARHESSTAEEGGYYLFASQANLQKLLSYIDANKGVFDFGLVGEDAYEIYRIENGILSEKELNDTYNPHEAKMLSDVCFTKGCYIGQEIIARLATYEKVQKYLTGFNFLNCQPAEKEFLLYDDAHNEIGSVTSSVYSQANHKSIGLGYIRKEFVESPKPIKGIGKTTKQEVLVSIHSLPFGNPHS